MARLALLFAPFLVMAGGLSAEPARAPVLGAASNFGQSWAPGLLDAADAQGIDQLRDEVHWDAVAKAGRFRYRTFLTRYPELLAARGMGMSLIVGGTHPDFDGGVTPYTPAGVAAFADFAAETAARFPAIDAVEVGNEANSESFTSGPALGRDIAGRADHYAALLHATHDAVKAARPGVRIVGGAAHSIPLAWFRALAGDGAAGWMDSVALHPYTTPPEQFRRQVALLRAIPGFAMMPIEVTELGTQDAAAAPALLVKSYCQMALAGVTHIDWYPLGARGDGFAPLIDAAGQPSAVGRSFAFLQRYLAGHDVTDTAPDPFTYACRFGPRALVIWGAARAVTLNDPALSAVDAEGRPVAAPQLSRSSPLVIVSTRAPVALGDTVSLGPQTVLADSYDQFAYPGAARGGFARFARRGTTKIPFVLGPGQEAGGVPWTPYLKAAHDGNLRMDARFLLPAVEEGEGVEIIHAWTAPAEMAVALEATVTPGADSADGVVLSVRLNGETLKTETVTAETTLHLPHIEVASGDVLEIAVGPGATAAGDASLYRFTLRRAP